MSIRPLLVHRDQLCVVRSLPSMLTQCSHEVWVAIEAPVTDNTQELAVPCSYSTGLLDEEQGQ
jgi:hypothetical protein